MPFPFEVGESDPRRAPASTDGDADRRPPRPLRSSFEQFGQPPEQPGRVAGFLMARLDDDDRWVVELLDVQPSDRLLEVGCGPGVAVALLAERARDGLVAGVDPSEVMVRQAIRRNRAAVRAGRVELRLGTAAALTMLAVIEKEHVR